MAFKFSYFSRETAVSLRRNPLMTVAGILTVAVSLFLFGGVLLLSAMVEHGTSRWKDDVELEIFMVADATDTQIKSVEAELKRSPEVKRYRFLTKADAFKEFKRMFADEPDVLDNVDPNILFDPNAEPVILAGEVRINVSEILKPWLAEANERKE